MDTPPDVGVIDILDQGLKQFGLIRRSQDPDLRRVAQDPPVLVCTSAAVATIQS